MNPDRRTRISKFLSMVLRHKPETIGITLDDAGWVDVRTLLSSMSAHGKTISREELEEVVATNEKKRFAFSEVGSRIRASQGHSVEVDLQLEPEVPPERLYHGTADRFLDAIRRDGLLKMNRQHVHLSAETRTAAAVGVRHGRLVLLTVRAAEMHAVGHRFYRSANGVWLADHVPAAFIDFPE